MIFIYPASVSETCDKRIVPAVCKSIERFFLLQLQDAISSGELSFYRKWEGNKYGPLLMESIIKPSNTKMLLEGFNDDKPHKSQDQIDEEHDYMKKKYELEQNRFRHQKQQDHKNNVARNWDRQYKEETDILNREYQQKRDEERDKYQQNRDRIIDERENKKISQAEANYELKKNEFGYKQQMEFLKIWIKSKNIQIT
jgi:hypothetical protein